MLGVVLFLLAVAIGAQARQQFIVGGDPVTIPTKWPWQGSLKTASGSHTCGCALIHANWVLTAAHCVGGSGYSMEFGTVVLGEGERAEAISILIHPDYEQGAGAFPNDIAIINTAVEEGNSIRPVSLSNGADVTTEECWISGWGRLQGGGALPTQLYDVEIPVIDSATCDRMWGGSYNQAVHVCVWDEDNLDKGACNGDSGGPLVCNVNAQWRLEGLASWVFSGCNTAYPCAYVRVYSYLNWICDESGNAPDDC